MSSIKPYALTLAIFLVVLFGCYLRCIALFDGMYIDDEWHAIDAALNLTLWQTISTFGANHFSNPIALYYKAVINTVGLNDLWIRIPALVSGIALCAFIPWLYRNLVTTNRALIWAFFMALSPLLIFFSRFARPYALMTLLSWIAVFAFYQWWLTRARRFLFLYLCTATVAVWLLPIALPFVGAPFIYGLLSSREQIIDTYKRLFIAAALFGVGLLCTVGAPLFYDLHALTSKSEATQLGTEALSALPSILLGSPLLSILVGASLLIMLGAYSFRRAHYALFYYLTLLSAMQLCVILLFPPSYSFFPFVVARYLIVLVPYLLLLLSFGVSALTAQLPGIAQSVAILVLGIIMLLSGPLTADLLRAAPWSTQLLGVTLNSSTYELRPSTQLPSPYAAIAAASEKSTIIEVSKNFFTIWGAELPSYQVLHQQKSLIGMLNGLCSPARWGEIPFNDDRIQLNAYVHLAHFTVTQPTYVIFHESLPHDPSTTYFAPPPVNMRECVEQFSKLYGAPYYQNQGVSAFRIDTSQSR